MLLDRPPYYGAEFQRPSKKTVQLERAGKLRMFERDELLAVLSAAGQPLRAMFLLGVSCGLGNADVGRLRLGHLNLATGWMEFARPKTGIARRCWLWPEAVDDIKDWLGMRPSPKRSEDADLVFLTRCGMPWHRDSDSYVALAHEVEKLLKRLGLKRPGLGFYCLRHTFATIASESRDQPAVDAVMGHIRDEVTCGYRERISDQRLKAISEHVRQWLFAPSEEAPAGEPPAILKLQHTA